MTITVKPSDIIERCLWAEYKKFCLKNLTEKEIEELIEEDEPVLITEDDAFVIGLLKIIQTDNLVHRFKLHMLDFLKNRSTIKEQKVIISKSTLIKECITFDSRFPESYKKRIIFEKAITELKSFIKELMVELENLEEIKMKLTQGGVAKTFTYIESKQVEKLIKI